MWWVFVGWSMVAAAAPGEAPATDPAEACRVAPPDPTAPFADELTRAIALYRGGCHRWALDLLRALDLRRKVEEVPRALSARAGLYLGELELVMGRPDEARAVFESVLLFEPDVSMSLLEHDPDAVDLFERTRATLPASVLPKLTPPSFTAKELVNRRLLTYVPLGIGPRAAGERRLALQVGLAEGFLGGNMLLSWYLFNQRWPSGGQIIDTNVGSPEAELRAAWTLRAWNHGAAITWVTSWAVTQATLNRRWRAAERARLEREWLERERARSLP